MQNMSDADLFAKLRGIVTRGTFNIPDYQGYGGYGAPGIILEELLGFDPNNRDGPDSGKWELKEQPLLRCSTKRLNLVGTCMLWLELAVGSMQKEELVFAIQYTENRSVALRLLMKITE